VAAVNLQEMPEVDWFKFAAVGASLVLAAVWIWLGSS
jgi:hypothetical protein